MNINDIESQVVIGDPLNEMFKRQLELVVKYQEIEGMPNWPMEPNSKISQVWFKDMAWRTTEELAEAMEALTDHYKSLSEGDNDLAAAHYAHFTEELADSFHFLLELLIISGIEPKDLEAYLPTQIGDEKGPLYYIFVVQNSLKESYQEVGNLPSIHEVAMEFIVDLGKAMNCLKNKPWKQSQVLTDVSKFRQLLLESFYSFIFLLVISGIKEMDLIDLYFRKSEVNKFRIRSAY